MSFPEKFLKLLRCPVTGQTVKVVEQHVIERINSGITAGKVLNRIGEQVTETVESGLTNQDESYLFPVRSRIITMVTDELIELDQL